MAPGEATAQTAAGYLVTVELTGGVKGLQRGSSLGQVLIRTDHTLGKAQVLFSKSHREVEELHRKPRYLPTAQTLGKLVLTSLL